MFPRTLSSLPIFRRKSNPFSQLIENQIPLFPLGSRLLPSLDGGGGESQTYCQCPDNHKGPPFCPGTGKRKEPRGNG